MTYTYISIGFYAMIAILSILLFCDAIVFQNKLYIILHILLFCIHFTTFHLFINLRQNQPMRAEAEIDTIPSAPVAY